jgi:glycosyltransferase involved in cell wall biosynthesis
VALRQAMARLLADPALRVRMGEAGRRKVVEFQAGSVVPRIEQLYGRLLNNGHAG